MSRLTNTAATESTPNFSPDGKSIIYAATSDGRPGTRLFVRSVVGEEERRLTDDAEFSDSSPCYSADGNQIAFVRAHRHRPYSMGGWTWDNDDVYVMGRDGSGLRRVTSHYYYQASHPRFIDGGKTLVFSASGDYPDLKMYMLSVSADGSQPPTRLTTPPAGKAKFAAWGSEPSVSPDGKHIAFISDRAAPFHYDVLVTSPDGSDIRPLGVTAISGYNHDPVYLPDGKAILFLAGTESNASSRPIFSLWQVGVDGSHPRRLAGSGLFSDPLHWSPTDSRIRSPVAPQGR